MLERFAGTHFLQLSQTGFSISPSKGTPLLSALTEKYFQMMLLVLGFFFYKIVFSEVEFGHLEKYQRTWRPGAHAYNIIAIISSVENQCDTIYREC